LRKNLSLALAGALILALGTAGVAQAVNSHQSVAVKLAHSKAGTAAKPKSVGALTVDMKVALDSSDQPFATRTATIHFDKNLVFNSAKFPSCTEAQVLSGAAACAKAKVGSGKAVGLALGLQQNLAVTAYNGPGGKAVLLHVTGSQPLKINSVIVGKLNPDSGAFGRKLVVTIPANLQQPLTGAYATLTSFKTTVGGSAHGTPYVALKGCSGGKLNYKGDFVFTDGSKQSPTSTGACTK
jgi:uncharacterized low-complexity protein